MSKKKELGLKARLREVDGEERGAILDGLPYEVGFGKPPRNNRFSPGNQAGKRGRPKGSENLATSLDEELDAKIEVTDGGKARKLSKRRVAIRQLVNKAATGDTKALAMWFELLRKTGGLVAQQSSETLALDPRDLETVDRLSEFLGVAEPVTMAGGTP